MTGAENSTDKGPDNLIFGLDDEDTQKDKYLTFSVGPEDYGIQISDVIEIICIQKITEVPDMPDFVKGVINLRGQVIPIIDVRSRFGMPSRAHDDRTCIIVVNLQEVMIGLIVDRVSDVRDIPEQNIDPPPAVSKGPASRYMQGMGQVDNEVKIILNLQKLLYDKRDPVASSHE